jgi:uncharacterized protein involved in exopolysaccharide biosynthesis
MAPGAQSSGGGVRKPISVGRYINDFITEFKTWLPEELRPARPAILNAEERHAAFVDGILSGVSVSGGTESEVLAVSYASADPRMAAKLANTFAETYIEYGLESRTSNVQQATSWLGRRIEELRKKAVLSEDALRVFQAREGLVDTAKREQIISAKLGTLTAEMIKAQSRRNEAEARYLQLKTVMDGERNRSRS